MNSIFSLYAVSTSWFLANGMRIVFVAVGAYLLVKLISAAADRMIQRAVHPDFRSGADEERKRKETLVRIIVRTVEISLYLIAAMMVLSEFGINIGPLIAGAGIAGVAIGFGSQQLVKDIISGLFIVLENRYHVGDSVVINGISGIVEDLNLRVTRIRDVDGAMHYIQNGAIATCSNYSTEGGRIHFSLKVSSKANLEQVKEIVSRIGKEFISDDLTKTSVRQPPSVTRIESFDKDWITLRISGDVATAKQWEIMSDFKLRLKEALDKEEIAASA